MRNTLLRSSLYVGVLLVMCDAYSQTVVPFVTRYQKSAKGSIDFVSNAIIECNGSGSGGANCADLATQLPPTSEDWSQNNDHRAKYIDIDGDGTTFSSSSDSLYLHDCSNVVFAGIYWGGRADNGEPGFPSRNEIKIRVNEGVYWNVSASSLIDAAAEEGLGNRVYYCFADITDLVKLHPIKSLYTVANVYSRLGLSDNLWGGWNIVVVYENDILPMRNLNVFDGLVNIDNTGTEVEVGITGFLTPSVGPVTFDIGVYAYDGDRGFTGDSLLFDGGAGFVPISNALNPADDIFNFSQTSESSVSTSQNPLIHNNISIDADIFSPDNSGFAYIGNSQTSATVKVTTDNETVQVQVITLAVDIQKPELKANVRVEDLNGGAVLPGDILEYTVVGKNIGSEISTLTYLVDTLGPNLEFVPGSIEIIHGPYSGVKTDAIDGDQGHYNAADKVVRVNIGTGATGYLGGVVLNTPTGEDSTVFTFQATVTDNCALLTCNNIIENQAYITGTGDVSDLFTSNPSTINFDGCQIVGTKVLTVDISDCVFPDDTTVEGYCEGVLFADFPYVGYDYFDDEYVLVTEATWVGIYYAINSPDIGCGDTIKISVLGYFSAPTTANAGSDQTVCIVPGTATLGGNNPLVGFGEWTVTSGGATITNPTLFNSGVTDLSSGINTFLWTITFASECPSSTDTVTINVDTIPTIANAGSDQFLCETDIATLEGNTAIFGVGSWSVILGSADVTTESLFNSGVTSLVVGTNTFRWTINGGTCPSTYDDVNLIVLIDSDDDGVCDQDDLDDDNDGIPDLTEGEFDIDGDGNLNSLDLDADNDGIPDIVEAGGVDIDGDGVLDAFIDSDDDGLGDEVDPDTGTPLPFPDTDVDGVFDIDDLDSDNDGTPDLIEAGGSDVDFNGRIDFVTDTDNDGFSDNVDTDDNTIPGPGDGGTPLEDPDSDVDGLKNRIDLDSDNDGIADLIERGGIDVDGDGQIDAFSDGDGDGWATIVDSDEGGTYLLGADNDLDDVENYLDLDSDNDGIVDAIEAGGTDADSDGKLDGFIDIDNDGFNDVVDTDDNTVLGPGDGGTSLALTDTDGTAGPNYLDIDSDDDGIPDNVEAQPSAGYIAPTNADSDGDGIDDSYDDDVGESIIPINTDVIDEPDYLDLDSDNDGETDNIEGHDFDGNGIADIVPTGSDSDNDGLDNAFDSVVLVDLTAFTNAANGAVDPLTDGDFADFDRPGVGDLDFRENDTDNDGVTDNIDIDDDNDGIPDLTEGNLDLDGDGIPNSLDLDSDNDGIPDLVEAGGVDTDRDGVLDAFIDSDDDGLGDEVDPDTGTPLPFPDTDVDGVFDIDDLDSDNDGTPDLIEATGIDIDFNGIVDDLTDTDSDGFADLVDTDNNNIIGPGDGGTALADSDSDGDGLENRIDLDSDNDGIADLKERGGMDTDGDGLLDAFTDPNGNGLGSEVDPGDGLGGTNLPGTDMDLDKVQDYLDRDSDNDGIVDAIEAGGIDEDGNGQLDGFVDVDNDGFNDIVDTDDNSVPGTGDGGTSLLFPNTDLTAGPNYLDIDSDDDGIPDNVEAQTSAGYTAPNDLDSDGDGIDDSYDIDSGGTPIIPVNTDGVDNPDYTDNDADNDSKFDLLEGHDLDGDGMADIVPSGLDDDNDGLDNTFDSVDLIEITAFTNGANGTVDPLTDGVFADADSPGAGDLDFREVDTDNDGIPNVFDLDADNDGIPDLVEDEDLDGDGDPLTNPTDTDNDGIIDLLDLDADNDGIPDIVEAGGVDINEDGRVDDVEVDGTLINDTDSDGLDDLYDSDNGGTNILNPDSDLDGNSDFQDLDSDDDTIFDRVEERGADTDSDGKVDKWADSDSDIIPDYADIDETGGLDINVDGIDDAIQTGSDQDNDGIGNDFDNDANGDGWDDDDKLTGLNDTDGDGIYDRLDLDSDDDTVPDIEENDPNNDGAGPDDTDGDGIPDFQDDNDDNDLFPTIEEAIKDAMGNYVDCNEDGIPDYLDPMPCGIIIPSGFSPDGDGINDLFVIEGIAAYPNTSIVIFNRWGDKVYESTNGYSNNWDGTSQFGVVIGSQLPEGTYFYVLDLGDGSIVKKGYVYIKR